MQFETLDAQMRKFEETLDMTVPQDHYLVARLDGRGFTKLTKETCDFEAPFDVRFRDAMVETAKHLLSCGFRAVYAYVQSDEISILFHPANEAFGGKVRKYNSVLAGEASAKCSLLLGTPAVFDCRLIALPFTADVVDYFAWRMQDATRNALNAHCYWGLRKQGSTVSVATAAVEGKSIAEKTAMLASLGVEFDALPAWQKRGMGILRGKVEKEGFDPVRGVKVVTQRTALVTEYDLPEREPYAKKIRALLHVEA